MAIDRQRIDKWLWHARVVRTRTAAAALAASGHVRVNAEKVAAASRLVRTGDVVTIALDRQVRILKILAFAGRRGAAEAGRALYDDLAAAAPRADAAPARAAPRRHRADAANASSARPTKRDRRAIERFTDPRDL